MNPETDKNANSQLAEVIQLLSDTEKLWEKIKSLKSKELADHVNSGGGFREIVVNLHNKVEKLSDDQVQAFIQNQQGAERISNLFFSTYNTCNQQENQLSDKNYSSRWLSRTVEELATRIPELAVADLAKANFFEQSSKVLDNALAQRDLFFYVARNGPKENSAPYMECSWHDKMAQDIKDNKVGDIPKNLLPTEISPLDGKTQMYLYGTGGFEISSIIAKIAAIDSIPPELEKQLSNSQILQRMFLFSTHPSPKNGHVSLSTDMLTSLANIAEKHPQLFAHFIDTKDPALGQTPREFFIANSDRENTPFEQLTDRKRHPIYSDESQRLVKALSNIPEKKQDIEKTNNKSVNAQSGNKASVDVSDMLKQAVTRAEDKYGVASNNALSALSVVNGNQPKFHNSGKQGSSLT